MTGAIDYFAQPCRIAVVGASNSPRKFGREIYRNLKQRGYDTVPVNPSTDSVDGDRCYPSLSAIPGEIEAAVIVIRPERARSVVTDAANSGFKHLWFQRGADFAEPARLAEEHGIEPVTGKCILMYAGEVRGIHKLHQVIARIFGNY